VAARRSKWNPSLHPRDARGRFTRSSTRVMKPADTKRARSATQGFQPAKIGGAGAAGGWLTRNGGAKPAQADTALGRYLAGGWRDTNTEIRRSKTPPPDVAEIDAEFAGLPEDLVLRRQVPLAMFAHIPVDQLVGMKVRDAAYASTSIDHPEAGPSAPDAVTLHIAAAAGTPAYVHADAGEILLARDTEIAIARAEPNGQGGWDLYGVVIPKTAVTRDQPAAGDRDQPAGGDTPTPAEDETTTPPAGDTDTGDEAPQAPAAAASVPAGAAAPPARQSGPGGEPTTSPPDTAGGGDGGRGAAVGGPRAAADQPRPNPREDPEGWARSLTDAELERWSATRGALPRVKKAIAAEQARRAEQDQGAQTPAAGTRTPAAGSLAALDPLDRERVRIAVEDHAGRIFRNPLIGGSTDNVGRYVAEGHLGALTERYGLSQVWRAVAQTVEERPELLERSDADADQGARERGEAAELLSTQAAGQVRDGDFAAALATIDQAERLDPDHRAGVGRSWDELRTIVARRQEETSRKPAGSATPRESVAGRAQLDAAIESGTSSTEKLDGGGIAQSVDLVTFNDGTQAVRKVTKDSKTIERSGVDQADAEEVTALIAAAAGAKVPAVHRAGDTETLTAYVDGQTGMEAMSVLGLGAAHTESLRLANTDPGRLLGLVDVLTDNPDRHTGNWIIDQAGDPVGIDHGNAFLYSGDPGSAGDNSWKPFAAHYMQWDAATGMPSGWADNDLTPADVQTVRERLAALRPEFDRMGHGDWHDFAMGRLDAVGAHATGDRNRIADGGTPAPAGTPGQPAGETPGQRIDPPTGGALAGLDPLDRERVRVAVEDKAATIFRTPFMGGSESNVARYTAEGRELAALTDRHGLATMAAAVRQIIDQRPGLLQRSDADVEAHRQARRQAAEARANTGADLAAAGDFTAARAEIDAGERIDPTWVFTSPGGPPLNWTAVRALVDDMERDRAAADAPEPAGDATPVADPTTPATDPASQMTATAASPRRTLLAADSGTDGAFLYFGTGDRPTDVGVPVSAMQLGRGNRSTVVFNDYVDSKPQGGEHRMGDRVWLAPLPPADVVDSYVAGIRDERRGGRPLDTGQPAAPPAAAEVPAAPEADPNGGMTVVKTRTGWAVKGGEPFYLAERKTKRAAQQWIDDAMTARRALADHEARKKQSAADLMERVGLEEVRPSQLAEGDVFTYKLGGGYTATVTAVENLGNGMVMVRLTPGPDAPDDAMPHLLLRDSDPVFRLQDPGRAQVWQDMIAADRAEAARELADLERGDQAGAPAPSAGTRVSVEDLDADEQGRALSGQTFARTARIDQDPDSTRLRMVRARVGNRELRVHDPASGDQLGTITEQRDGGWTATTTDGREMGAGLDVEAAIGALENPDPAGPADSDVPAADQPAAAGRPVSELQRGDYVTVTGRPPGGEQQTTRTGYVTAVMATGRSNEQMVSLSEFPIGAGRTELVIAAPTAPTVPATPPADPDVVLWRNPTNGRPVPNPSQVSIVRGQVVRDTRREEAVRAQLAQRAGTDAPTGRDTPATPPQAGEGGGWPDQSGGGDPPDGVELYPMDRLRAELKYGTDGFNYGRPSGWKLLLNRAVEDPRTPEWMASIAENGMQPIQVTFDDDVPGSTGRQAELHNGNHRLALALLMGVQDIPISSRDLENWDDEGGKVAVRLGGSPVTDMPDGAADVIARAQAIVARRRQADAALNADTPGEAGTADTPAPAAGPPEQLDLAGGATPFDASRTEVGLPERPQVGRERAIAATQQLGLFASDEREMDGQVGLLDALLNMPAGDTAGPPPDAPPRPLPEAPGQDNAGEELPAEPTSIVPDDLSNWSDEQLADLFRDVSGVESVDQLDEPGLQRIADEWDRREQAMADLVATVPDDLTALGDGDVETLYARLTGELGTLDHDAVRRVEADLDRRTAEQAAEAGNAPKRALLARPVADLTDEEIETAAGYAADLGDEPAIVRVFAEWERRDTAREAAQAAAQAAQAVREQEAHAQAVRDAEAATQAAAERAAQARQAARTDAMIAAQAASVIPQPVDREIRDAARVLGPDGLRRLYGDPQVDEWLAGVPGDPADAPDSVVATALGNGVMRLEPRQRLRAFDAAADVETGDMAGRSDKELLDIITDGVMATGDDRQQAKARGRVAHRERTRRAIEQERFKGRRAFSEWLARARVDNPADLTDAELETAPGVVAALSDDDDPALAGRLADLRAEADRRMASAQQRADDLAAGPAGPARLANPVEHLARLQRMVEGYGSSGEARDAADRLRRARAVTFGLGEDATDKDINTAARKDPRPLPDQAAQIIAWYRHYGRFADLPDDLPDYRQWLRGPADEDVPDTPEPLPAANVSKPDEVWDQIKANAQQEFQADQYETGRRLLRAIGRAYRVPVEDDIPATLEGLTELQRRVGAALNADQRTPRQRAGFLLAEFRRLAAEDGIDPADTLRYGPPDKAGRTPARASFRTSTPEQEQRIDALVARGWDWLDAYAEVHGADSDALRRERARGVSGGSEKAMRQQYAEWVAMQAKEAEAATAGHMLTKKAETRGVDVVKLFSGPWSTARANASEELLRWWAEHPRMTYAEWKAMLAGGSDARAARERMIGAGKGNEFA